MLTRKTRYAIMALTALAKEYGKGPVPMSHIASSKNIPLRFLEGILLEFKRSGILKSARGVDGGYYLAIPPEDISLAQIIDKTEGSLMPVSCLDCDNGNKCEFDWVPESCGIRRAFADLYFEVQSKVENTTLKDLIQV
ncbi:MAG: Rrf2 family transcriptional regulator [Bacteroidales bacterium]|nr:Rrf2 family transcriptional regulator [Bacteroidales bacterium]